MSHPRDTRAAHDDRGAALLIAIGFMVLVGFIVGGLAALINSGVGDTVVLSKLRDRQYAAEAAVQQGVAAARSALTADPNANWCSAGTHTYNDVNGTAIRVGCTQTVKVTFDSGALYDQRDVLFLACTDTANPCTDSSATLVLRAEVLFSMQAGGPNTFVQSWSLLP